MDPKIGKETVLNHSTSPTPSNAFPVQNLLSISKMHHFHDELFFFVISNALFKDRAGEQNNLCVVQSLLIQKYCLSFDNFYNYTEPEGKLFVCTVIRLHGTLPSSAKTPPKLRFINHLICSFSMKICPNNPFKMSVKGGLPSSICS